MKKIVTFAYLLIAFTTLTFAAQKQVRVSTAQEFFAAIADNREIIICAEDGILLTPDLIDMAANEEIREYDNFTRARQVGIFADQETDGPQLIISGIKNLTIRSEVSDSRRTIEVTPRYAFVLKFISCENITCKDLYLGHTREGYCSNGVLGFDDCHNVKIQNCGLYGCGTEGIEARKTTNLEVTDSEIYECSYSILHLYGCTDCTFRHCYFYKNKEYDLIGIDASCKNILFDSCTMAANKGLLFSFGNQSNTCLRRCIIHHTGSLCDETITCDSDCIFLR